MKWFLFFIFIVCIASVSATDSWSVRFDRERFVFNPGVVSFKVMFFKDNVLSVPPGLSAVVNLPQGLVSIPLSSVVDGVYMFYFDFSSMNISSVDVFFSWDDGSRVLPLNFVSVPLVLADNPVSYPQVVDVNGRLDAKSLWVLIGVVCLVIVLIFVGVWRWVVK